MVSRANTKKKTQLQEVKEGENLNGITVIFYLTQKRQQRRSRGIGQLTKKTKSTLAAIKTALSIITLNRLNVPHQK